MRYIASLQIIPHVELMIYNEIISTIENCAFDIQDSAMAWVPELKQGW